MIFNIQLPVDIKNKKCFALAKHFLFFGSIFSLFVRFLLCVSCSSSIAYNVPALCEVASFVTEYFRLLLNFLRKINVNLPHNSQSRKTCVGSSFYFSFSIILNISGFLFDIFRFKFWLSSYSS